MKRTKAILALLLAAVFVFTSVSTDFWKLNVKAAYSEDTDEDMDATVDLTGTLTSETSSASDVQLSLILVDTGKAIDKEDVTYKNMSLVIVIDLSSSLSSQDIAAIKSAAATFATSFLDETNAPYAEIGVVFFAEKVHTINFGSSAQPVYFSNNATAVTTAINGFQLPWREGNNGTNTEQALEQAGTILGDADTDAFKCVILLSDGCPNFVNGSISSDYQHSAPYSSASGAAAAEAAADDVKNAGVKILTIAYGAAATPESVANNVLADISSIGKTISATQTLEDVSEAFGKITTIIEGGDTAFATNKTLTIVLEEENFTFTDKTTTKVIEIEDGTVDIDNIPLVCKKTANQLATQYYNAETGKIVVPGVKSVTLSYTLDGADYTVELGTLNIEIAVRKWNVNYFVQKNIENDAEFATTYTTEYRYLAQNENFIAPAGSESDYEEFVLNASNTKAVNELGEYNAEDYDAAQTEEIRDEQGNITGWNVTYMLKAAEEPVDEPETPTDEPEDPTDEPEDPTDEPEDPTDEPEDPTDEPEDPTDEPEDPTEEPEDPTDEPEDPTDEPEEPTEEPEDPVEEPTEIIDEPEIPQTEPEDPVEEIEEIEEEEIPQSEPEAPVEEIEEIDEPEIPQEDPVMPQTGEKNGLVVVATGAAALMLAIVAFLSKKRK